MSGELLPYDEDRFGKIGSNLPARKTDFEKAIEQLNAVTLPAIEWMSLPDPMIFRVRFWHYDLPVGFNGEIVRVVVFWPSDSKPYAKRLRDV